MFKENKTFIILIVFLLNGLIACSQNDEGESLLSPEKKHVDQTRLINKILSQHHYRQSLLDDSLSVKVFNNYFDALDPNKYYFTKSDIQYFNKYRDKLDDFIAKGETDVAFQIFRLYKQKVLSRLDSIFVNIERGFDFTLDEYYDADFDTRDWVSTNEELNDRWRKAIKLQYLNIKLSNKEDDGIKDVLTSRYQRLKKNLEQFKSEDVYQLFMNSYTSVYDPHTSYFSPMSSENFKINMSLSLEGIGARLSQTIDFTVINEVLPGGPAYKSERLKKDDKIIGVAQGDDGLFDDVIGWRLDEVVQKIRGPKGSIVKLLILDKKNEESGIPDTVRLIRDKIKLEEQSAKADIIPISKGKREFKVGLIDIPSFYLDFEGARRNLPDYKSTTRDVKKLIDSLKNEGVNGLLIDLRFNGGGSLQEAIDLTGLFITTGPVVQVKNADGTIEVKRDNDPKVYFDGPMMVLVNRYSASASEIFSAAIQDYERGVVVGENTYGKGSVQQLIALDRYIASEDEAGQLKLTLAKFYRINGSSTQNIGVKPNIEFPTPYEAIEIGESAQPYALPWDNIPSSNFHKTKMVSSKTIEKLGDEFKKDLSNDKEMITFVDNIKEARLNKNDKKVSLNYKVRLEEKEKQEEEEVLSQTDGKQTSDFKEKTKGDLFLKESIMLFSDYFEMKK